MVNVRIEVNRCGSGGEFLVLEPAAPLGAAVADLHLNARNGNVSVCLQSIKI